MRTWGLPLLALTFSLAVAAQELNTPTPVLKLDGLQIPAELTKTIKAEKANAGDEVHLRMAEPVLVGQGLVIPENAKLHGLILRASAAEKGERSRISILVDRAEWKGHVLPLRAFIAGLGVRKRVLNDSVECNTRTSTTDAPHPKSRKNSLPPSYSSDSSFDDCTSADTGGEMAIERSRSKMLSEIQMFRNPASGFTVLISNKNIHLPDGIMLLLRNSEEAPLTAKK